MTRPDPSEKVDDHIRNDVVDGGDPNPLGDADIEEMVSTAYDTMGMTPEIDTSFKGIAIPAVAKAVSARIRNGSYTSDPKALSVFLISDRARIDANNLGAMKEPIVDNGSITLAGCLWIAAPQFRSAYRRGFSSDTAAGVFGEIEALGIDDRAIILFDPNATDFELRFYPNGVRDPDQVQLFLISQHEFSIDALDRVLTRFYETAIRTPDASTGPEGPWIDPAKYIPRKDTEAFLQDLLKIALNAGFDHPFVCEFEKPGTEGRCDLMLVSRHPTKKNTRIHHAVMELKVFRSLTSGANPVSNTTRTAAIEKGLNQAIAYKSEQDAEAAMLCCFDMRKVEHCDGDSCFFPVANKASLASVELRRYRLFGSSEDYRAFAYGE